MAGFFTITAARNGANPCVADYIVGQPFNLIFAGDSGEPGFGDGFVIRWTIGRGDCDPSHQVNNGTRVGAATESMTTGTPGELFYTGTIFDRHGNPTYTSPCLPLCFVEDKAEPTVTITTTTPEILIHETPDVTVHIDGDGHAGGGINGAWGPSNPEIDCDNPVAYATLWGVTAGFDSGGDAPIGRQLDECGQWAFSFNYGGSACNKPVNTGCIDLVEVFCTIPAVPELTTIAAPSMGFVGEILQDSAELLHAYRPTGTITFLLFGPDDDDCSGGAVYSEVIDVDGNGSYETTTGAQPTAPGTYQWRAFYSGDDNNDPVATDCGEEPVELVANEVTLTTTISGDGVVGDTISDTAHLDTTGPAPGGTITFKLYGPDGEGCGGGSLVYSETVPVTDIGDYTPTAGPTIMMPGVYQWIAQYSGDAFHPSADTACGEEPVDVTSSDMYSPTITTQANGLPITPGDNATDTATLSGGNHPTGVLHFLLFGPDPTGGDADCSGDAVYTVDTPIDHFNGHYPATPHPLMASGVYHWRVMYDGDALNNPYATDCDDPAEKVTVTSTEVQGVIVSGWIIG